MTDSTPARIAAADMIERKGMEWTMNFLTNYFWHHNCPFGRKMLAIRHWVQRIEARNND